jgi:O-antigen/teichoic acid export membrane protein
VGKTLIRNILSNWTALILNILVGFFMMPFVIRTLGTEEYGFWVLLQALISYMFLLDFGVRSSLNRYLAKSLSEEDSEEVNRVFNTGWAAYLIVASIVVCLSCVTAVVLPWFFTFPTLDSGTISWATVVVGVSVAIRFPTAVLEALLTGLLRYDLMNILQITSLLVRTILIVFALVTGYGVLEMAFATLFAGVLELSFGYVFAIRLYPQLTIAPSLARRSTLKVLANHSIYAYSIVTTNRVVTDAGIIIAGLVAGATAAAIYGIATTLTSYATSVVSGISTVVPPMASTLEARGDAEGLIALYVRGSKFILLVGLPILLTFIISGQAFLSLWVGEEMVASYGPLVLLSLGWAFNYGQTAAVCILIGLSRHKVAAWLSLIQALLHLALSSILGYQYGLLGIAWGAFISSAIIATLIQIHAMRELGIPPRRFLLEALIPTALSLVPFVSVLFLLSASLPPHSLFTYFLQVAMAVSSMLILLPWVGMDRQERTAVWGKLNRWIQTLRGSSSPARAPLIAKSE